MLKNLRGPGLVGCIVALLAVGGANSQEEAEQPQGESSAPARAPAPESKPFSPGLDDLMTMLVQPRHQRLYLAGNRKNWELAAFQARELRASFRRISEVYPRYQGLDVPHAVEAMVMPAMKELDAAIASANSTRFEAAFGRVTKGCNDCHTYTEHPFLVMKVPDPRAEQSFSDQEFAPTPP